MLRSFFFESLCAPLPAPGCMHLTCLFLSSFWMTQRSRSLSFLPSFPLSFSFPPSLLLRCRLCRVPTRSPFLVAFCVPSFEGQVFFVCCMLTPSLLLLFLSRLLLCPIRVQSPCSRSVLSLPHSSSSRSVWTLVSLTSIHARNQGSTFKLLRIRS